jgi:hypothetical protein
MAETYVMNIRELPSRKLRKRVRSFLKGGEVSVEDVDGHRYTVVVQKNKLLLREDFHPGSLEFCGHPDQEFGKWGPSLS